MGLFDWLIMFIARQSWNFRVLLICNAMRRFFGDLSMQYRQLYVRVLGASSVELGFVNSISSILRTIMAIPTGMLMDKYSLKKLMLLCGGMGIFVPLIYTLAFDWRLIILAMVWEVVVMRITMPASFLSEFVSLRDEDKTTGRGLSSTIMSISAMIASFAGGFLVVKFGGISVEGIRPLFIIQFFGSFLVLFILFFLKDVKLRPVKRSMSILKDWLSIFKTSPHLKLMVLINIIRMSSMQMIMAFRNVYLVEMKGADAPILALMGVISSAIVIMIALPIGRIIDRFGKKRFIYLLRPLQWVSMLILVFAPSPEYLLLAAVLDGFSRISMEVVWTSFIFELVPMDAHGRMGGTMDLFNGIGGIITPIIGGLLYETAPEIIFYIGIVTDISVMPLIHVLPERERT